MPILTKFRLDRSRLAAPQVFESLREAILTLELVPGAMLVRSDLAGQFGVSQTPIREALLRLEEEGLVEVFPQHATLVSRIDVAAAREAHFLRRSIDLEIVRTLALQPPPGLVVQLQAQCALQESLAAAQRYDDFLGADHGFHRLMYEAAGVMGLWALVRRYSGHVDRLRRLHLPTAGKTGVIMRQHRAILDAIDRQNAPAAQEALREHLSGTLSAVDDVCAQHPDYILQG